MERLGKVIEGDAFYVAEGKYIVSSSQLPALKKIIDRNKAAVLSKAMQAGLKETGSTNIVTVFVDLKDMPVQEKLARFAIFLGIFLSESQIKDFDKVQSLSVKINEPDGKYKLSAELSCGDKANAAAVKAFVEDRRRLFRSVTEVGVAADSQNNILQRALLDAIRQERGDGARQRGAAVAGVTLSAARNRRRRAESAPNFIKSRIIWLSPL